MSTAPSRSPARTRVPGGARAAAGRRRRPATSRRAGAAGAGPRPPPTRRPDAGPLACAAVGAPSSADRRSRPGRRARRRCPRSCPARGRGRRGRAGLATAVVARRRPGPEPSAGRRSPDRPTVLANLDLAEAASPTASRSARARRSSARRSMAAWSARRRLGGPALRVGPASAGGRSAIGGTAQTSSRAGGSSRDRRGSTAMRPAARVEQIAEPVGEARSFRRRRRRRGDLSDGTEGAVATVACLDEIVERQPVERVELLEDHRPQPARRLGVVRVGALARLVDDEVDDAERVLLRRRSSSSRARRSGPRRRSARGSRRSPPG